jgi:hypothetical protein
MRAQKQEKIPNCFFIEFFSKHYILKCLKIKKYEILKVSKKPKHSFFYVFVILAAAKNFSKKYISCNTSHYLSFTFEIFMNFATLQAYFRILK